MDQPDAAAAPVMAATAWRDNGAMIADMHRIGYLREEDVILDPTYGAGVWWKRWAPAKLIGNCYDPEQPETSTVTEYGTVPGDGYAHRTSPGFDYRAIPYGDGTFDAAVFDPPYVAPGGRETSTLGMHAQYGMRSTPATPRLLHEMNAAGLAEVARVVIPARRLAGPGGTIIVKCQDYIWSGTFQPATQWMVDTASDLGLALIDRLEHISRPRPQPATQRRCALCARKLLKGDVRCECGGDPADVPIRQVHARRNLSTVLVFRRHAAGAREPQGQQP